jgi:hypothetical protein
LTDHRDRVLHPDEGSRLHHGQLMDLGRVEDSVLMMLAQAHVHDVSILALDVAVEVQDVTRHPAEQ